MARRDKEWPTSVRVINVTKGTVLGEDVSVARTVWSRGRGLMLRAPLAPATGLLIDPCSSIHTMWMRFPIDVLYVDDGDTVVRADTAMPPWRIGPLFTKARYVVELPPGTISASRTTGGDRLRYEPASPPD